MEHVYEVAEIKTADTLALRIRITVRNTQKIMLDAAISIGQDLIDAKELVDHGEWENWLEEKVDFSQSKANKYMKIAREYGQISKTDSCTIMSYSNALKLLALPEEDRTAFIENNDVESLTVKELEEKIKAMKVINEEDAKDKEKLQKDLEAEKQITEQLNKQIKTAEEDLLKIEKSPDMSHEAVLELKDKQEEIDQLLADLEKSKQAKAKVEEKLAKATEEKNKEVEEAKTKAIEEAESKLEEVKAQARKEAGKELAEARASIEKLSKELEAAGNEDILTIKLKTADMQEAFDACMNCMQSLDEVMDTKMRRYLTAVLNKMLERVEE